MSRLNRDLAAVNLKAVHLLQRMLQVLGTVKAHLAAALANALMAAGLLV